MKPSRPKEQRLYDQVQRGLAAERLVGDEVVIAWFESERARLTTKMLEADIGDDAARRDAAIELKAISRLRQHLEIEAQQGRMAHQQQEKATSHG